MLINSIYEHQIRFKRVLFVHQKPGLSYYLPPPSADRSYIHFLLLLPQTYSNRVLLTHKSVGGCNQPLTDRPMANRQ